jgi:hypothetical protein
MRDTGPDTDGSMRRPGEGTVGAEYVVTESSLEPESWLDCVVAKSSL